MFTSCRKILEYSYFQLLKIEFYLAKKLFQLLRISTRVRTASRVESLILKCMTYTIWNLREFSQFLKSLFLLRFIWNFCIITLYFVHFLTIIRHFWCVYLRLMHTWKLCGFKCGSQLTVVDQQSGRIWLIYLTRLLLIEGLLTLQLHLNTSKIQSLNLHFDREVLTYATMLPSRVLKRIVQCIAVCT